MNDSFGVAAILAVVLNLLAVVHYSTRLRRDIIEQVKADEKRWSEHETKILLLERSFEDSQVMLKGRLDSIEARLEQTHELLLRQLSELTALHAGASSRESKIDRR